MTAFEFLVELKQKSEWHNLVINNNALAGKMVEFAELYYKEKLKDFKAEIPEMFDDLVDQRIKELEEEIENCKNPMREYNLEKQLSNLCECKEKIWSGYYNASR